MKLARFALTAESERLKASRAAAPARKEPAIASVVPATTPATASNPAASRAMWTANTGPSTSGRPFYASGRHRGT